jgi:hemin uptake protein HemP
MKPLSKSATEATREAPQETSRLRLKDLLKERREIEIDHGGRIYRLRLTQANKLILTA